MPPLRGCVQKYDCTGTRWETKAGTPISRILVLAERGSFIDDRARDFCVRAGLGKVRYEKGLC